MKRITVISFAAFIFVFCVNASLYAISIGDWTFTNDYDSMVCITNLPNPMDAFDARYDQEMGIYVILNDVSVGDTDQFKWSYNGQPHTETEQYLFLESGGFCHGSYLPIKNTQREYMTGWWAVEVYLNGVLRMRESVYLEGLPQSTTTTSYSSHPTTSINTPNPCMMSSIYGEDSVETDLLRYFRDNVLSQTPEGRELICLYYQWSPVIVRTMEEDEEFKEEAKQMIDGVLPMIEGL